MHVPYAPRRNIPHNRGGGDSPHPSQTFSNCLPSVIRPTCGWRLTGEVRDWRPIIPTLGGQISKPSSIVDILRNAERETTAMGCLEVDSKCGRRVSPRPNIGSRRTPFLATPEIGVDVSRLWRAGEVLI